GAKLVFPGAAMDGASLYELFEAEGVTMSAGVPTVWQGLLNHVEQHGLTFSSMRRTMIGGSACPPAMMEMFEKKYHVSVLHAWGMTETSPLGSTASLKAKHSGLDEKSVFAIKRKQGRPPFGVDMKLLGPDGTEQP